MKFQQIHNDELDSLEIQKDIKTTLEKQTQTKLREPSKKPYCKKEPQIPW